MKSNVQAAFVNGCSNQLLNGLISWITIVHLFGYQFLASLGAMDQVINGSLDQLINGPNFKKVLRGE